MRIIRCDIDGFGKFQSASFSFQEGYQEICQENGWGKTTLCAFFKAMFYGMEYSRKRELSQREKYRPWGTEIYGGSMEFSYQGKEYRVHRTFGKKDSDDTLEIYDLSTGRLTDEFGDALGETIFQVDRASFEKSTFLPQGSLDTGMTDSLNAKMGDLEAAHNDIDNFELATKAMKEAVTKYSSKSSVNPGKLNAAKNELNFCKKELEKEDALKEGYELQQEMIREKNREIAKLNQEKEKISQRILEQSKLERAMGEYKTKVELLEQTKKSLEEMDDFFANGIPSEEDIKSLEEENNQYIIEKAQREELALKLEETEVFQELFATKVPRESELEQWEKQAEEIRNLRNEAEQVKMPQQYRQQWEDLQQFFRKKHPTLSEIEIMEEQAVELLQLEGKIKEITNRCQELRVKKEAKEEQRNENKGKGIHFVFYVMAVMLFLGSGALFAFRQEGILYLIFSILCLVAGVAVLVIHRIEVLHYKKSQMQQVEDFEIAIRKEEEQLEIQKQRQQNLKEDVKAFVVEFRLTPSENIQGMIGEIRKNMELYESLQQEAKNSESQTSAVTERLVELQMALYAALEPFARVYEIELFEEAREQELLLNLRKELTQYQLYCQEKQKKDELEKSIEKRCHQLETFLNRYWFEEETYEGKISKLKVYKEKQKTLIQRIQVLEKEIEEMAQQQQVDNTEQSVEKLQQLGVQLEEQIAKETLNQKELEEQRNEKVRQLEQLEEIGERKEQLEELVEQYQHRVDILQKTMDYLNQAKDLFLMEYMQPLQSGLQRYLDMMLEESGEKAKQIQVQLDMDLNLRIMTVAGGKGKDYLSEGYQDLVSFCARLALIDVLYPEEKPMLFLDDPFTNLDQEKIVCGQKLLQKLALDRQIIYYTCHESRRLK